MADKIDLWRLFLNHQGTETYCKFCYISLSNHENWKKHLEISHQAEFALFKEQLKETLKGDPNG